MIDRFRSLPISRLAVVFGRILADALRIVWGILIIVAFGAVLGFRPHGAPVGVPVGALGAALVVTAFGMTVCWPMADGLHRRSPPAAPSRSTPEGS